MRKISIWSKGVRKENPEKAGNSDIKRNLRNPSASLFVAPSKISPGLEQKDLPTIYPTSLKLQAISTD
jgi:hypothetical protein